MRNSTNTCPHCVITVSAVERSTISSILSKKGLHGTLFLIGEVLFITRPLVYVLFIRKYGIRSWTPWFLSLAIDCIGMSILSLVTTSAAGGKEKMFHLFAPEKDEVWVSLELYPKWRYKLHQGFMVFYMSLGQ